MSNQPTINLPAMHEFAGVWIPIQGILGIDMRDYKEGDAERSIIVKIVGPHEFDLDAESADLFKAWWDQVTGQARIQVATPRQGAQRTSGIIV